MYRRIGGEWEPLRPAGFALIGGPLPKAFQLVIYEPQSKRPFSITTVRDSVDVPSLQSIRIDDNDAQQWLLHFSDADDWLELLQQVTMVRAHLLAHHAAMQERASSLTIHQASAGGASSSTMYTTRAQPMWVSQDVVVGTGRAVQAGDVLGVRWTQWSMPTSLTAVVRPYSAYLGHRSPPCSNGAAAANEGGPRSDAQTEDGMALHSLLGRCSLLGEPTATRGDERRPHRLTVAATHGPGLVAADVGSCLAGLMKDGVRLLASANYDLASDQTSECDDGGSQHPPLFVEIQVLKLKKTQVCGEASDESGSAAKFGEQSKSLEQAFQLAAGVQPAAIWGPMRQHRLGREEAAALESSAQQLEEERSEEERSEEERSEEEQSEEEQSEEERSEEERSEEERSEEERSEEERTSEKERLEASEASLAPRMVSEGYCRSRRRRAKLKDASMHPSRSDQGKTREEIRMGSGKVGSGPAHTMVQVAGKTVLGKVRRGKTSESVYVEGMDAGVRCSPHKVSGSGPPGCDCILCFFGLEHIEDPRARRPIAAQPVSVSDLFRDTPQRPSGRHTSMAVAE